MLFRSFIKITLNIIYLSFLKIHLESLTVTIVLQVFIHIAFIEERVHLSVTLMRMILQPHLFPFVLHSCCIMLSVSILSVHCFDCVLIG